MGALRHLQEGSKTYLQILAFLSKPNKRPHQHSQFFPASHNLSKPLCNLNCSNNLSSRLSLTPNQRLNSHQRFSHHTTSVQIRRQRQRAIRLQTSLATQNQILSRWTSLAGATSQNSRDGVTAIHSATNRRSQPSQRSQRTLSRTWSQSNMTHSRNYFEFNLIPRTSQCPTTPASHHSLCFSFLVSFQTRTPVCPSTFWKPSKPHLNSNSGSRATHI